MAYGDKDYHSLSPLLEQLSPEELLEVLTPRQMIAALRVYEARNPDQRILHHTSGD